MEFGRVHAEQVAATVAAYLRLFAAKQTRSGDLESIVDDLGAAALVRIDGWAPELADEIGGIADGSGQPVARIAAINARTEILARLAPGGVDECSTVVVLGGPAGPIAMQNWDWYDAMSANWLQWTIPFPDGRRVTTITEYGVVGKIGVNDRGVGTLFNILHHHADGIVRDRADGVQDHRADGAGIGVAVHVIARRILDVADSMAAGFTIAAEAVGVGVSASTSITIVDPTDAVCAEVWPGGLGHARPDERGLLFRTNHFLSPLAARGDTWRERGSDTMDRYAELSGRLGGRTDLTPGDIWAALRDHDSGLCCHPRPEDGELRNATLATVALDLAGGLIEVSAGNPCSAVE